MTETHEPTSEFIARLEWQVRSTLSRRDRFSMPTRRPVQQVMKMAALVLLSVFLGAAGVATADQVQESRARDLLIAQIDIEFQIVEAKLQLLRTRVEEFRNEYNAGLINESGLNSANHELRAVELEYVRLQLDREEIMFSGREPQQSVSAPLLNDRDFVTERLDLELALAAEEREVLDARLADAAKLVEQGLMHATELKEQQAVSMSLMQRMNHLKVLYGLRQRFLDEELSREEVEREAMLAEARSQLDYAAVETARDNLTRIEELYKQGAIAESEVVQARMLTMVTQLKLQQVLVRIEQLTSAASEPPPM